jgi:hypothetical protein
MLFFGLAVTVSSAYAFALVDPITGNPYYGPVDFKLSGYSYSADTTYDPGTTYGLDETYLISNVGGLYPETWAIVNLTSIEIPGSSDQVWSSSGSGERIYGLVYGLYDWNVSPGGTFGVQISQIGGLFDLYLDTDSHVGEYNTGLGLAGRTAFNAYNTVTNTSGSVPFLSGKFNPGVQSPEPAGPPPTAPYTTIRQDVTGSTSPVTGKGTGYADLTGGNYFSLFNGNGQTDAYGTNHDLFFLFDVKLPVDNTRTVGIDESTIWSQSINDPATGNAVVPEPSTMLMFGMGMMGLATRVIRRKKVA